MHDLGAAAGFIDQRAQKLMHGNIMPGFFQHLAQGGVARRFTIVKFAFGKHPFVALAQPHHRDQRSCLLPQHNASRR